MFDSSSCSLFWFLKFLFYYLCGSDSDLVWKYAAIKEEKKIRTK